MSEVVDLIEPINNNPQYKNFTLRNNKVLLTYQKIRLSKEEYINWIELNIAHLKGFSVAHETYEDEDLEGEDFYHTHVLLHFAKQPCWTNVVRKFDYEVEGVNYHPNIRILLTPFHYENVVNYLHKQDPSPFTNIILNSSVRKEEECLELIEAIRNKKHFKDVLVDKDICYKVMMRMNWAREIFNTKSPIIPNTVLTLKTLRPYQTKLYNLLLNPPKKREIFWLYSEKAETGKSSFIDYLYKRFTIIYGCNKLNDFYNIYNNEDIIVYDMSYASSKKLEEQLTSSIEDISSLRSYMLNTYETLSNKGAFSCSKYQGKAGCITSHLIICSNCPPNVVEPYLPNRLVPIKAEL